MKTTPYTYLIGWPELNKWYYGSRYAKGCDPSELWVKYFTSSKQVKEFRKKHGEPTVKTVRKIFVDSVSVRMWEHRVLKRLKVIHDDKWLNKTDNKAIAPQPGELNPMFGKVGELSHRCGSTLPIHSKKIIGEKSRLKKGNMPPGFSEKMREIVTGRKHKISTKQNISNSLTGRNLSDDHKKNISLNHADVAGEKNPFFGKAHSDDQKKKWKESRAGKVWISKKHISKLVKNDEVDHYLNDGWTKGRGKKDGT